jgi:hypothetical protein
MPENSQAGRAITHFRVIASPAMARFASCAMADAGTPPPPSEKPLALLNRILAASEPADLVELPEHQAQLLAMLSVRELGQLAQQMKKLGAAEALRRFGLFSRRAQVVPEITGGDFAVHRRRQQSHQPNS